MHIWRYASTRGGNSKYIDVVKDFSIHDETKHSYTDCVIYNADGGIKIAALGQPYGDSSTKYNITVVLTIADCTAIVTMLGDCSTIRHAPELQRLLSGHTKSLVKLLACATGLTEKPFVNIKPADNDDE